MADIVVRIKTNEGYDEVETFSSSREVNNVSTPTTQTTTQNDGVNGKTRAFGFLSLSDGYLGGKDTQLTSEVDKYNGYMFGVTDENREYIVDIEISGSAFDKINIVGDKSANQFPTVAILDMGTENEKTLYNDDLNWGIGFNTTADTHTIRFTDWNRAGYNACFTTLTVFVESIELNSAYIQELTSKSESNFDTTSINYGVVSNSGDLKLLDIEGELADYIRDGIIDNSNMPVEVVLNGKTVQHHITNDSSYNDRERVLSLGLTNNMSLWDTIEYDGIELIKGSITAYELLENVMSFVGYSSIESMVSSPAVYGLDDRVGTVKTYLEETNIEYPYLDKSTFREAVEKICDMLGLNVYEDENGEPKFVSSRPVATQEEISGASEISSYMQIGELEKDIVVKNKIKSVGVIENTHFLEVKRIFSFGTTFFNQTLDTETRNVTDHPTLKHITGYSGILDNYSKNLSINEGAEYIKDSPLPMSGTNGYFYLVKVRFTTNEKSYFENWFFNNLFGGAGLGPSDGSMNVTMDTLNLIIKPTAWSTNNFLTNDNYIANDSILPQDGGYPYQYVSSESEALSNLCNYNGSNITSIKSDIKIQIVRQGKEFTIYFVVAAYDYLQYNISGYTGELSRIILNGTNYVYQTCLSSTTTDTTENKDYVLTSSELIATNNKINGNTVVSCLTNNILEDYKNGVMSAEIDTFCGDYYDKDGNKTVNFKNGDLLKPNSVVFIEGDKGADGNQRYWRVCGSNFDFSGDYTNKIKLVEIVKTY